MDRGRLSIGDLARRTGAKVETIRYYERIGLLPEPARTRGNYRAYSMQHLARLSFVHRARTLGFGLDAVRELLRLSDLHDQSCEEVDRIARSHLRDVVRKVADLTKLGDELGRIIGQCGKGTVANCRVIDVLCAVLEPLTASAAHHD